MSTYNPITGQKNPESPVAIKNFEFTRPANTTAYTIGDSVAPDTKAISAATNAAPAVLTCAAHGLATGDRVTISGAVTMTSINGDFVVTVLTSSTFKISTEAGYLLGAFIAGNGVYGGSGVFQKMLRMADVVAIDAGEAQLVALQLFALSATVTLGTFRIRLFNQPQSAIADNAANTLLYANRAAHVGYVDMAIVATDGAGSDQSVILSVPAQPILFGCGSGRRDLFFQIIALGAYVPASAETFRLVAKFNRVQAQNVSLVPGN